MSRPLAALLLLAPGAAAEVPLDRGGSCYFLRVQPSFLLTADELNGDRHGPTDSRNGFRFSLRNGWEFRGRGGGSPIALVLSVDPAYERRTMVGVLDDRVPTNPFVDAEGMPPYYSAELLALYQAWEQARPLLQQRPRETHHLSVFGLDLGVGLRAFPLPGDTVVLELRAFGGPGLGTISGASYRGWHGGLAAGILFRTRAGSRLGLELGHAWRGGEIGDYDADHRGRAVEVGGPSS